MNESFSIYILSFLVVIIGYGVSSAIVNRPHVQTGKAEAAQLPSLLRMTWPFANILGESIGSLNDSFFPSRRASIQNTLMIAGLSISPDIIFASEAIYAVSGGLLFALITLLLTRTSFIVIAAMLLGVLCGGLFPTNRISRMAKERQEKILRELPFAIDLIGAAMRAGVDFVAAIRYYVTTEKGNSPLAEEFSIVLRSMEMNSTRIEAITQMGKRVQIDVFTAFCDAVVHGMEVGGSYVNILKVQAEQLRRERFNLAERKAARAASSMIFPIAIFIMPAMFIIIAAPVLIRVVASGLANVMK